MALFGLVGRPPVARWKRRGKVRRLVGALRHRDPRVRREAAEALGELGDVEAVEPLVAALEDPEVRAEVAAALGTLGDPSAVPDLQRAMAAWEEPGPALDALDALGWTPDASAAGALYHAHRGDWEAVAEVGEAGVPVIVEFLQGPSLPGAAAALDRWGWRPEVSARGARFCIELLRWEEAAALGVVAVEPLLERLETTVYREDAIAALVAVGLPATEALVVALRHERPWVREAAARCLGELEVGASVRSLAAVLQDPAPEVRRAAAVALGRIGDERAVAPLARALAGAVGPVAAEALGRIGGGVAVRALADALDAVPAASRLAAVKALGRTGDPRAASVLVPLLRDRLSAVRMHAAIALGRIGTRAGVDELMGSLAEDTDNDVRCAAARALGAIGDPRAVPALVAATSGFFHEWVRRAAAEALGSMVASEGLDEGSRRVLAHHADALALLGVDLGV